jgi:hypothetical protein
MSHEADRREEARATAAPSASTPGGVLTHFSEPASLSEEPNPIPDAPGDLLLSLRRIFQEHAPLTIGAALLIAVGLVWVSIEVVEKFKSFREFLTETLAHSLEPPPTLQPGTELAFWPATILLAGGLFLLAFFLYSVSAFWNLRALRSERNQLASQKLVLQASYRQAASERDRLTGAHTQLIGERDSMRTMLEKEREIVQATLSARNLSLQRTLNGTIRAASMIQSQLFPAVSNGAGKSFESVRFIYFVNRNFDVEVHRHYRLRAGKTPIHFWQNSIGVSPHAAAVETLVDLNFRVMSRSAGNEIVYLPTRNEPLRKAACIFFLPRIEPGDTRELEVAYTWPKMAFQLKAQGWEEFSVKLTNTENLAAYSLEIFLEPGTGGSLHCAESGVRLPNMGIERAVNHLGWEGWRYSATEVPPELLSDKISLRIEWIQA